MTKTTMTKAVLAIVLGGIVSAAASGCATESVAEAPTPSVEARPTRVESGLRVEESSARRTALTYRRKDALVRLESAAAGSGRDSTFTLDGVRVSRLVSAGATPTAAEVEAAITGARAKLETLDDDALRRTVVMTLGAADAMLYELGMDGASRALDVKQSQLVAHTPIVLAAIARTRPSLLPASLAPLVEIRAESIASSVAELHVSTDEASAISPKAYGNGGISEDKGATCGGCFGNCGPNCNSLPSWLFGGFGIICYLHDAACCEWGAAVPLCS